MAANNNKSRGITGKTRQLDRRKQCRKDIKGRAEALFNKERPKKDTAIRARASREVAKV